MSPGPGLGYGPGFGLGRGFGRGFRRGLGSGRGRGSRWTGFGGFWAYPYYPTTPYPFQPGREEESAWLADQARDLEEQLHQVQKRLAELEKEKGTKK